MGTLSGILFVLGILMLWFVSFLVTTMTAESIMERVTDDDERVDVVVGTVVIIYFACSLLALAVVI